MASMGAVQSAILGTVMENKMAVATMEGRRWVREEHLSTEETWGVGHITLGDVCAENAQPLVQEWSPEALGDGSAEGAGLLALVAARGADEQWAQILGGLGWAAVEMVGGSALDFAREWLWQLLPSPEDRACGIAAFAFAIIGVMDVINIELLCPAPTNCRRAVQTRTSGNASNAVINQTGFSVRV